MKFNTLYETAQIGSAIRDPEVAHLTIHHNQIIGLNKIPGLDIDTEEKEDGVKVSITVKEGMVIIKPVHLCFGMLPESGIQRITMEVEIQRNARMSVLAHCIFPNAVEVKHIMKAKVIVGEGAGYTYLEKHIHGPQGGVEVYPTARMELERKSRFKTVFELLKGRAGKIDIDYETTCREESTMEMITRISGRGDDIIKIREVGHLTGERARGVLTSRVAVREQARAEVYNKLTATAAYSRGHVDCKEIVQDSAVAMATPIVEVRHPKARITHEAAIGSVDTKQLETLMTRGLSEEEAVGLIIEGLLM